MTLAKAQRRQGRKEQDFAEARCWRERFGHRPGTQCQERRRAEDEVRLRGVVDAVTSPGFTILGVTIQTDARTIDQNV